MPITRNIGPMSGSGASRQLNHLLLIGARSNIIKRASSSTSSPVVARRRVNQIRSKMSGEESGAFPVAAAIQTKLTEAFAPSHLEVSNESNMHNVPADSETHFKVVIVSDKFNEAKSLLSRHRMVNDALKDEVATSGPVHALSIVAKTPDQWDRMMQEGKSIGASPNCRGWDGSLPSRRNGDTY